MSTFKPKYAVDLSNDGVSLSRRDKTGAWKLIGKVALSSENFSAEVENLKAGHTAGFDGKWIVQVRVPNSEVFISDINLGGLKGDTVTSKVNTFLGRNTPYSADDLVYDLVRKPNDDISYVAAITKETMAEARDFISGYGFEAAYYTAQLDKSDFPGHPRFYDAQHPVSVPSPVAEKPAPKTDDIAVPPPPAAIIKPKAEIKAEKPQIKKATSDQKTDLSSFATIRSKTFVASGKSAIKADVPSLKAPPKPQSRISIEIPELDKITPVKKVAKVVAPVKMPQTATIQTDVRGIFKPRYILILVAAILLGLLYWFYNTLIDGKAEITQLQRISDTPPAIQAAPRALQPQSSTDNAPQMAAIPVTASSRGPARQAPTALNAPDPVNQPQNTTRLATVQNPQTPDTTTLGTVLAEQEALAKALKKNAQNNTSGQDPVVAALDIEPSPNAENTPLIPTKAGTPGPEGITLFLGQPEFIPPQRDQLKISPDPLKDILPKMRSKAFEQSIQPIAQPAPQPQTKPEPHVTETASQEPPTGTAQPQTPDLLALADPTLNSKQPRPRPPSIAQTANNLKNSLLARADPALAGSKPKRRPANLNVPVARIDPTDIEIAIKQAVAETARPRVRPRSLNNTVERAKATIQTASLIPPTAAGTSKAGSPSPVNIQKEATESSRFNKRQISLVGVSGSSSNRRALVRMPSGRYLTVKSGQKFNGWKVAAIGESTVRITKGNRNKVLRMPE